MLCNAYKYAVVGGRWPLFHFFVAGAVLIMVSGKRTGESMQHTSYITCVDCYIAEGLR